MAQYKKRHCWSCCHLVGHNSNSFCSLKKLIRAKNAGACKEHAFDRGLFTREVVKDRG